MHDDLDFKMLSEEIQHMIKAAEESMKQEANSKFGETDFTDTTTQGGF